MFTNVSKTFVHFLSIYFYLYMLHKMQIKKTVSLSTDENKAILLIKIYLNLKVLAVREIHPFLHSVVLPVTKVCIVTHHSISFMQDKYKTIYLSGK